MSNPTKSYLTHLECPECGKVLDANRIQTFCQDCRSPLVAKYDLESLRKALTQAEISDRPRGIWRWAELLPVQDEQFRLTLGEGDTPLLRIPRIAGRMGLTNLYVKEEALNPTASFKARGLVLAVSRALELGIREFFIPTAGNAGGALAAYAARAGVQAHVYMPQDAPHINQVEVQKFGADLHLVEGLISDAARIGSAEADAHNWFDVSTFKEPYRLEGKKTMGLELAEAFGWDVPDVIFYPTGGGTGLVGMWKAFAELEELGWIGPKRPRMVSVQAEGCAPVVRAFQQGAQRTETWQNARTIAAGLRVPTVFADRQILRAIAESQGTAIAVSDDEIVAAQSTLAQEEGLFACPEGAAALVALEKLRTSGWIKPAENIVLFNTGSGIKYI